MNNKDYLSQDEIDALLRQAADMDQGNQQEPYPSVEQFLTPLEQDALGEIGNITFGNAATALSTLLGKKVDITTPRVSAIAKEDLEGEFPQPHVAVHVKYVEGFNGINLLVIKTVDAQIIADLMMGGDGIVEGGELTEMHISAVQEAMNQMMGSSATSMSTIFNRFVNISPPGINILDFSDASETATHLPQEDVYVKVSFRLTIDGLIDSQIMQLLPIPFAKDIVNSLLGSDESTTSESEAISPSGNVEQSSTYASTPDPTPDHIAESPVRGYGQDAPQAQMPPPANDTRPHAVSADAALNQSEAANQWNVQPVQFSGFQQPTALSPSEASNLDLLMDIPLKVTVELGRTHKQIKEILELSQGSIIELDKLAGEPVDILVNNKFVAKGEVVVIDENFGVRVTDIINQWDRIQKLQ